MSILNTARLPLIFISGVFIPISAMPQIGQKIALISPLTYGNDTIEYALPANYIYKKFNE
jgi:ABC-2 type transport system permease protein